MSGLTADLAGRRGYGYASFLTHRVRGWVIRFRAFRYGKADYPREGDRSQPERRVEGFGSVRLFGRDRYICRDCFSHDYSDPSGAAAGVCPPPLRIRHRAATTVATSTPVSTLPTIVPASRYGRPSCSGRGGAMSFMPIRPGPACPWFSPAGSVGGGESCLNLRDSSATPPNPARPPTTAPPRAAGEFSSLTTTRISATVRANSEDTVLNKPLCD